MTLSVTTLGYIFQAILTLDAYRIKNNIQIFMQCVCNVCLSISTILQYSQVKDANARITKGYNMFNKPFAKNERNFWQNIAPGLIVCIAVSCACSVSMIVLVFGLHRQFAWALYKHVSPDKRIQDRYFVYQVSLQIHLGNAKYLIYYRYTLSCSSSPHSSFLLLFSFTALSMSILWSLNFHWLWASCRSRSYISHLPCTLSGTSRELEWQ